jgi:hypothetical protein
MVAFLGLGLSLLASAIVLMVEPTATDAVLNPRSVGHLIALFVPIAVSAVFFGSVHGEVQNLTPARLSYLYGANLIGVFAGGLVFGCLLPSLFHVSFLYSLVIMPVVIAAVASLCYRSCDRRYVVGYATTVVVITALLFSFVPWPHTRYYTAMMRRHVSVDTPSGHFPVAVWPFHIPQVTDVREDWSSSVWLYEDYLYVNGRHQTPRISKPYRRPRDVQVLTPLLFKHRQEIYFVGVGLGITNGRLARLLPEAHIVNVDYSPALLYFIDKYAAYNADLLRRSNAVTRILDGRLGLLTIAQTFDVIMEFTVLEGAPGVSTIKSYEFFSLAKSRLRPYGVFIGYGTTTAYAATLQRVFTHVYKLEGAPVFVASEVSVDDLLDIPAARSSLEHDTDLQAALASRSLPLQLIELPALTGRLIFDTDPVADYRALAKDVDETFVPSSRRIPLLIAESK